MKEQKLNEKNFFKDREFLDPRPNQYWDKENGVTQKRGKGIKYSALGIGKVRGQSGIDNSIIKSTPLDKSKCEQCGGKGTYWAKLKGKSRLTNCDLCCVTT